MVRPKEVRMKWLKTHLSHTPLYSPLTHSLSPFSSSAASSLSITLSKDMDLYETHFYPDDGFILPPDYRCAFTDPFPEHVFIYLVDDDHSIMGLHDGDCCILTFTEDICDAFGSEESIEVVIQHTELLRFTVWLRVPTDVYPTDPDYGAFLGDPYGSDSGDADTDPSDPSYHDGRNDDDDSDPADPPAYLAAAAPTEPAYSDSDTVDSDDDDSTSSYTGSVVT